MTLANKLICVIKGKESTLFVLPSEVASELELTDDDLLKFEVKNGRLIIRKIDHEDKQFSREGDDEK